MSAGFGILYALRQLVVKYLCFVSLFRKWMTKWQLRIYYIICSTYFLWSNIFNPLCFWLGEQIKWPIEAIIMVLHLLLILLFFLDVVIWEFRAWSHVDGLSAYILFGIIYISFLPLLGPGSYTPISAISFIRVFLHSFHSTLNLHKYCVISTFYMLFWSTIQRFDMERIYYKLLYFVALFWS